MKVMIFASVFVGMLAGAALAVQSAPGQVHPVHME